MNDKASKIYGSKMCGFARPFLRMEPEKAFFCGQAGKNPE